MNKMIRIVLIFGMVILSTGCGCNKKNSDIVNAKYISVINNVDNLFTDEDLNFNYDNSTIYQVSDDKDITIDNGGFYVISGSSNNTSIIIDTDSYVHLVLDNLTINNDFNPCIYVKNAKCVYIHIINNNNLSVNNFENKDAVIYSKDNIVINGSGNLNITSLKNGITSKGYIKIAGASININSQKDSIEASNYIAIYNGNINIISKKDGLHSEDSKNSDVGYIYIKNGNIKINASSNAIHATTYLEIDGGKIDISAYEGLEATYIQINDGSINIEASDDGINAGLKSNIVSPTIEINGGSININMGPGDTDAIDSNGDIFVNGGILNLNCNSAFDADNSATYNGGKIVVNGSLINKIVVQNG